MMLNHAIYNATIFNEKMASGYKLIVPTREPVSWFKSAALESDVCTCVLKCKKLNLDMNGIKYYCHQAVGLNNIKYDY